MNKKRLRSSIAGIAISCSLLSSASLAVAKPAIGFQAFVQKPPFTSIEYISLAKTVSFNVNRLNFGPTIADVTKTEQSEATPVPTTAPESDESQKKTTAAPAKMKPETKKTSNKKASVHTNAAPSIQLQKKSAQTHTLEISPGKTVTYKRLIPVMATAYTAAAAENGWGPIDYYGNPLKLGTIAVDPSVIPLGSTVYITGYKYKGLPAKGMIAKATDTGSAIKGKHVDIFVPVSRSDANEFGMQDVKIYIIK